MGNQNRTEHGNRSRRQDQQTFRHGGQRDALALRRLSRGFRPGADAAAGHDRRAGGAALVRALRAARRDGSRRLVRRPRHRPPGRGAAGARIPHRRTRDERRRRVLPRGPHRLCRGGRGGRDGHARPRHPLGLLRQRRQSALRAGDRRPPGAGSRRRGVHRPHRLRQPDDAPHPARRVARSGVMQTKRHVTTTNRWHA